MIIFTVRVAELRKKRTRRNDAETLLHREDIRRQLLKFFLSKNVPNLEKILVKNRIWVQGYNEPSFVLIGQEMAKKNIGSPRMIHVVYT